MSIQADVVISPATSTSPVVVAVSQATRAMGSCAKIASSTLSEIWSHNLSGCPSVTDSLVKNAFGIFIKLLIWKFSFFFGEDLLCARFPGIQVFILLRSESIDTHSHCLQFETRDLLIKFDGQVIDGRLQFRRMSKHVVGAETLVCKTHGHYTGGMSCRRREINETSLSQEVDMAAIGVGVLVNEVTHTPPGGCEFLKLWNIDLIVEMACICDDCTILHALQMLAINDIDIACDGDEDIAQGGSFYPRHDPVAIHDSFQGMSGINLGDDDVRAHAVSTRCQATTTPTIAAHDYCAASQQDVGRAQNGINDTLSGPIAVIKHVLVSDSLTASTGNFRTPSRSILRSRITPVVVSSMPPIMAGMSSVRAVWMVETRSQPSSIVMFGLWSSTVFM